MSNEQNPTAEYVAELSTVIMDGQQEQQVRLPIASNAYIAPGSVFSITITEVSLQDLEGIHYMLSGTYANVYWGSCFSAQEGSGPEAAGPTQLIVTDNVANALIGFDPNSLTASVIDGKLMCYRFATSFVTW